MSEKSSATLMTSGANLEAAGGVRHPAFLGQSVPAALQHGRLGHCRQLPRQQRAGGSELIRESDLSPGGLFQRHRHRRRRGDGPVFRRGGQGQSGAVCLHHRILRAGVRGDPHGGGDRGGTKDPCPDGDAGGGAAGVAGLFPGLLCRVPRFCHVQLLCGDPAGYGGQPAPAHFSRHFFGDKHCAGPPFLWERLEWACGLRRLRPSSPSS